MKTFGEYKIEARKRLFPTGEASNLVAQHDKSFIDALVNLQHFVDCIQFDHTTVVPHCATFFRCGLTVFDAPRGNILGVSVVESNASGATGATGVTGETSVPGLLAGTVIGTLSYTAAIFDPAFPQVIVASIEKQGTYQIIINGKNSASQYFNASNVQYFQVNIYYTDIGGTPQTAVKKIWLRSADQTETITVSLPANSGVEFQITPVNQPYTDGASTITVTVKVGQSSQAQSGSGQSSSVTSKLIDWCGEIRYDQVDFCHVRSFLSRNAAPKSCCNLGTAFALYDCGKTRFPEPTDAGLSSLQPLPFGFHYAQPSTDAKRRAKRGVWAIERGKIYIAPWIQSTESVLVKWDGIKRTWASGDPFDEDPLLAKAIEAFVLEEHERKFNKDYDAAAAAKDDFDESLMMLMRQCEEENRVRKCETSRARGSQFSTATLFFNEFQTYTAKCQSGQTGDDVTVNIQAGTVGSNISVADANQQALAEAQSQAESQLNCSTTYYNTAQTYTAQCVAGTNAPAASGNPVTVTIPAGTVTSTVSQSDADSKALDQATTQATSQLSCTWFNAPQTYTAKCVSPATGADSTASVASGVFSSTISQADADAQASAKAKNDAQAALSCVGGTIYWNTQQTSVFSSRCLIRSGTTITWQMVTVTCIVAAHQFNSNISQADANTLAYNYGLSLASARSFSICGALQAGQTPPSNTINYP